MGAQSAAGAASEPRPQIERPVGRSWLAIAASVPGLVVGAAYVAIQVDQGERPGRIAIWMIFILVPSVFALIGGAPSWSPSVRVVALGAATGGLLAVGVLGLLSIGAPLFVAGILANVAWVRLVRETRPTPKGTAALSAAAAIGMAASVLVPFFASTD